MTPPPPASGWGSSPSALSGAGLRLHLKPIPSFFLHASWPWGSPWPWVGAGKDPQPSAYRSHQARGGKSLVREGARFAPSAGREAPALPGSLVACGQELPQAERVGGGGRLGPAPNSIWSPKRMDFSCCILSQPQPTLLSHPEAATQVQQQILYLPDSKFRYESPPPSSLLPLLSGAELRETQGGAGEGGHLRASQQTCVSNAEVTDSTVGAPLGGRRRRRGRVLLHLLRGGHPPSACPASRN